MRFGLNAVLLVLIGMIAAPAGAQDVRLNADWKVDLTATRVSDTAQVWVQREYDFSERQRARANDLMATMAAIIDMGWMKKLEGAAAAEIPKDHTVWEGEFRDTTGLHNVEFRYAADKETRKPLTLRAQARCKVSRHSRPEGMMKIVKGLLTVEVDLAQFSFHGIELGTGDNAIRVPNTLGKHQANVLVSGNLTPESTAVARALELVTYGDFTGGDYWSLHKCRNHTAFNQVQGVSHGLLVSTKQGDPSATRFSYNIDGPNLEPQVSWQQLGQKGWPLQLYTSQHIGRTTVTNQQVKTWLTVTVTQQ